ncbi:hypothetical protein COV19_01010 [Candidatus Woesearchaeota archaeon CG10_big_fil_rev_8_21_14_0_10_44_13]|nr:MAG: hypothetical protein COV19_01010 [Candidatus Woesearchaeota archaeon CG10_big_fil_rev_8_21_14_0_10_44_13]
MMESAVKMAEVKDIIEVIKEMQEDTSVPKNVKSKLLAIETMLLSTEENSMQVNRAVDVLVDISDDVNLQPFVRTKIWNIVSMLESL